MDAEPFVDFLSAETYTTKEAFLDAVVSGGQPAEFVPFSLSLRANRNTRPTLKAFRKQLKLMRSRNSTARWFGPAAQETYNLYRLMLLRCRPRSHVFAEDVAVAPSRKVRRKLARTGLCAPRVPSIATSAANSAAALWKCMKGAVYVLWFDNFYRRHFHPTPHETNTSFNCTAIAVAPVSRALEFVWGFPSLPTLQASTAQVANLLTSTQSDLMSAIRSIGDGDVPLQDIRCPLDIRRTAVHSTPWHPFMLSELQSGTQSDLLALVIAVAEIQDQTERVLPVLVDEKIHYSIMKMLYSSSYHEYDIGHKLCRTPPVFGIWHPYKYTVTVTYRLFFPLMVAFSNGVVPVGAPVYAFPKLIFMERMFACLFVTAAKYKVRIQQKLTLLRARCHPPLVVSSPAGRLLGQAHALYVLLFEYTPALFLIGHLVRECGWSACSGEVAHKVLRYCFVALSHLLYEFRYNVEYLRTVGTALLVWGRWYDILPGRCHVEESCEALLARLVASMRANPQCKTLESCCDLFLILKAASGAEKNLHDSRIQRGLC